MLTDSQTNFVYVADTLPEKLPAFATRFLDSLRANGIPFGLIPGTRDIWAKDYMPIQVSECRFVHFTYNPDYLRDSRKWRTTITDVDAVCARMGIKTVQSDILIDGGNVVRWNDKVLMTEKVFSENPGYKEEKLIDELKDLLEVEAICLVPVAKGDILGHTDGMCRFVSTDTILVNDPLQGPPDRTGFIERLESAGLHWRPFEYNYYASKGISDATGLYLNYLELEAHIILPVFHLDTDEAAIRQAKQHFPDKQVVPVYSREPAKHTGVLNCLTWNIRK
jgi:agmatine deiminase